jgi:peptidoglycan-associated lipoprotein
MPLFQSTRLKSFLLVLICVSAFACCKSKAKMSGDGMADDGGVIPSASDGGPLKDIHFEYDSSSISSMDQSVMKDNAKWMIQNPSSKVQVEGHCDERGTVEYNLALGERRAKAAFDMLRSLGVNKNQMTTISYGEEIPLDPGHTEAAWAKNRRAHFAVQQ